MMVKYKDCPKQEETPKHRLTILGTGFCLENRTDCDYANNNYKIKSDSGENIFCGCGYK